MSHNESIVGDAMRMVKSEIPESTSYFTFHPSLFDQLEHPMSRDKKLSIRNSTAEFLIFTRQAGEDGIEVRMAEETVWLTQKLISVLFDKGRSTITEHFALARIVQNQLFESDFDNMINMLPVRGDETHAEARRTRRKKL